MKTKIILDTDIGDDIDDALALALILASPELELVGVTTVFGNAYARSRQARTILAAAGHRFRSIPVAVGCTRAVTTFPYHGLLAIFADSARLPNQDKTCMSDAELPPNDPRHGVDFLIDTLMQGNGDIIPVLIGAMTNLALAIVKQPAIVKKIPRLSIMAAEFRRPMAEWNIRCDPEAAAIVFNSGIPIDLIPWHIGDVVQFTWDDIHRLAAGKHPVCDRLSQAIHAWQTQHNPEANPAVTPMPRLYDPMAVATLIKPDLCTWKTGTIQVELSGKLTHGYTPFQENPAGKHRIAWDADRSASIKFFLDRVLSGF
jgi:purine nucleosidase/pyrimidine-specific ribonucleoside hydrolase